MYLSMVKHTFDPPMCLQYVPVSLLFLSTGPQEPLPIKAF